MRERERASIIVHPWKEERNRRNEEVRRRRRAIWRGEKRQRQIGGNPRYRVCDHRGASVCIRARIHNDAAACVWSERERERSLPEETRGGGAEEKEATQEKEGGKRIGKKKEDDGGGG